MNKKNNKIRWSVLLFLFLNINLFAQISNKILFAWGDNSLGQIGDSTLIKKNFPVKIGKKNNWKQVKTGYRHTVGIKNNGSLWAWGDNIYGQLGIGSYGGQLGDGTSVYRANPIRVGLDTNWKQVDAGGFFTIALKNDGSLWAWGNNYEGQLGIGTVNGNTPNGWTIPVKVGNSTDWKQISAGDKHVMALKNDGTLWAWGDNYFGQLGDSTEINKLVPTQIGVNNDWKEIEAGYDNTLAIKNNGSLWLIGKPNPYVIYHGPTQLGTDTDWKALGNGAFLKAAIKKDGSLWFLNYTSPNDGLMFNPQKEVSSTEWTQISVGFYHAAAIKKDSSLWTWGRNNEEQLGRDGSSVIPMPVDTSKKWLQASLGEMYTIATEYDCTAPSPPSVSNINYYKHELAPPLTAVGSNLQWYSYAASEISTTTALIPSNSVVGTTPYYVSQTVNGCESQTAEIKVNTLACDGSKECLDRVALYVGFDFEVQGRTVGFFNRSKATAYSWDFGDNSTESVEVSPTHEYVNAGAYNVRLIANNTNNQRDTAIHLVKVQGINSVTPSRGGIGSYVTVNLDGYGFDANSRIFLKSATGQIVSPEEIKVNSISNATAIFTIPSTAEIGVYDVIASINGISDTLRQGFELETSESPIFNVNLVGPTTIRAGVKRKFSIVVKSLSNTDAFMVPLSLTGIPGIADVKLLTPVSYKLPLELINDPNILRLQASANYQKIQNPIKYDSTKNEKFFFLFLPKIPAESTVTIDFEINIPNLISNPVIDFSLDYKIYPPYIANNPDLLRLSRNSIQLRNSNCDVFNLMENCSEFALDFLPFKELPNCALGMSKFLTKLFLLGTDNIDYEVRDIGNDFVSATASCIQAIPGEGQAAKVIINLLKAYDGANNGYGCLSGIGSCIADGLRDTDKDGFDDLTDKCPTVWGKGYQINSRGCPDSDGDGFGDMQDNCPTLHSLYNNGCPSDEDEKKKGKRSPPPSPKREGKHQIRAGNSLDPNAKYVSGWGAENISKSRNLAYIITFENLASAAFAAQKVVVKDTIDKTKLNVATFRFLGFGFNKSSFIVDEHKQFFQLIDLRPAIAAKVAIKGYLDEERGIVTWEFSTLNATTLKEIEDDLVGFLPPNTTSPQGEGFVSFSIDVMPTFKTGDAVVNKSSIIFDNNPPIITNEVSAKIDEIAPQSQMSLVSISTNKDTATLSVSGTDIISGIREYSIYKSVNDSTYTFVETTTKTSLKYPVLRGKSYKFYSTAVDNVGNQELPPSVADVSFTIEPNLCLKSDTTKLNSTTCFQNLAGIFTIKLQNRLGCDSIVIKTITYTPAIKPTITRSNDTLTSSLALTYQWYRNDTLLGGSINRILKTSIAGNYKVEITDANGCKALSDIFVVTNTPRFDCPILNKNIGDICDDSNPNTQNDKIQSNCTCAGTPVTNILTLNCPINISVIAAVGQTSVVVNYTIPTATSTCTIGNITVTPSSTNPASGTAFPIGTKTLSFTASDGCGNTKTCSFTITVVANTNPCAGDVTKPITKCKTTTVYLNQNGKAIISGSDINNGSTDNCSTALSFAVSPNTFDCSKIGSNTVILTATDAASNNSTCSTIVNVSDNSAPVFSKCPANISLTTPNSCASATWTNPIVTDNCSTPSVSSNYNSGYCFSIGSKSVVYTATDAKGNKATCNFTVTVTAANTCTNVFSSNKCYKIVNKKSGKLLDVYGALKVNNTPIIQWNANNGANQKWRFISVGSGYVKIVAQNSGKEVACHRTTNNSLVYQYDYASGGAKDWKIECVNNSGYYKITHRLSGKVLDVKNGSSSDGQNIVISNFNANNNSQLWQIVEVTCPTQTYNLASSTIFDINGQAEFDRNRIGFTTNQGFRTDFFTVEKQEKVSGLFEPLEILNNKQVDNNAQYNTVYDNSPYQGDNFYRVKMTYLSGDFEYSAIQKIVNTQKADFIIFPNPASNEAWIDLKSFEGRTIDILMSDVAGKVLRHEKIDKATVAPYRLDLTDIQNGSYLLTIQTKGKRTVVGKLSILK